MQEEPGENNCEKSCNSCNSCTTEEDELPASCLETYVASLQEKPKCKTKRKLPKTELD